MAASRARDLGPAGPVAARTTQHGRARLNADTSAEPEGLTRRVVLNILEAFFRRPWLHLLPLILMLALGVVTAFGTGSAYRSVGTLAVSSSTAIEEITQENAPGGTFETPATLAARSINEQLRTDRFVDLVAQTAGLDTSPAQVGILRQEIRKDVSAAADGDTLVRVSATSDRPQLSLDLANATLEAYRQTVLDKELRQSREAEEFQQGQVDEAQAVLTEAETALDQFLIDNPVESSEDRPPQQAVVEQRLQADVERAETRYSAALDTLDAAELNTARAEIELQQRLEVQDPPQLPGAEEPKLQKAALTLIVFGVLGVMLALASVVVAATLDRTIRLPNDITGKFGLDVLAVVPDARRR